MYRGLILLLALAVLSSGCTNTNSFEGYKTLSTKTVKTIGSDVVEMVHEKSGASIVLIKNDDQARSFMAGFRTPPYDDTGLFHIFEHAVLEGSRLYPSKSNFFHLANSSVASFINAMTGATYTLYPFVTRSPKDFDNLMSVYMDAVFFPKVLEDPRIIQREGWRYEVSPDNKTMSINGIVLSEMKGAYSSPYRSLNFELTKALVPDTPFAYESGGMPAQIATLTFEQIVEAHKKYYHPQNSVIYLYGDLDYKKLLAEIDKNFLSHFEKQENFNRPTINLQTDFNYETAVVEGTYPSPKGRDRDFVAKGYVLGDQLSTPEQSAVQVLMQAFIANNAAPLKLEILKQGLAKSTFTMGHGGQDNALSLVFEGANASDREAINKVIKQEMRKIVESGFDQELLNSILNKYEFYYKEKNSNGAHKGMQLGSVVLQNWLYQDQPLEEALDFVTEFKEIRKLLKEPEFIKRVFKDLLLENNRTRWVVLRPDPNFSTKFNAGLAKLVEKALKTKNLKEYASEFKTYEKWAASKETPEILQKTPTLKLSDIKKDQKPLPFEKSTMGDTEVLSYPQATSGISYINLFFDIKGVSQDQLKNLDLLTSFIKKTNTKNLDFKDVSKQVDTYIGSLGFSVSTPQSAKDPKKFRHEMVVSLRFLNENKDKAFELVTELLTQSEFGPEERLQTLISEIKSNMKSSKASRAPGLASVASSRPFLPTYSGFVYATGGPAFEKYMSNKGMDIVKLQNALQEMRGHIFSQNRLALISITAAPEDLEPLAAAIGQIKSKLPKTTSQNQVWDFSKQKVYDGFAIPGEVQYVYEAASYKEADLDYSGVMNVYAKYLNNNYMTPKLREQAGAYGGRAYFTRSGIFKMSTYKDPNLKKSYEIFSGVTDFMEKEKLSADVLRPAILGSLKPYYSDDALAEKTGFMTELYRSERDWEDYIQTKKEILGTTVEQINVITKGLKKALKKSNKAVSGNKQKLKKEAPFIKNTLSL